MNKKTSYYLAGLTGLAILLVCCLYWRAEQPYRVKNNFKRNYVEVLKESLAIRAPVELIGLSFDGQDRWYVYGASEERLYRFDKENFKLESLDIPWALPDHTTPFALQTHANRLYFGYVNRKDLYVYNLDKKDFYYHRLVEQPYQRLVTPDEKVMMSYSDSTRKPAILQQRLDYPWTGMIRKPWANELKGVIPVDGAFSYDRVTGLRVYHYYRKNGFMVMDSGLITITRGKTVDTVVKGSVKVKAINGGFTLAAPPQIVNGRACADDGKLYINGLLKADNEENSQFRNHTVIDVYDLKKGVYLYSFYVPVFNQQKMNVFGVSGDRMVCLYGDYVVVYKMSAVA